MLSSKKIEKYTSYYEKNYQVSSYEIQEFDTLGNVICRLFKNKKDSITYSLYCNYEFQHGKLTSENFFYDKYGEPFQENTYKFYPNGFLKENKSMVEKNLQYLYYYYYKQSNNPLLGLLTIYYPIKSLQKNFASLRENITQKQFLVLCIKITNAKSPISKTSLYLHLFLCIVHSNR
ncbi:MAG: hypothetical protein HQ463_06550 [Bacteroidetes bacterium]|nr:hypothetical protein [Bacteroidota bacterium]